MFENAKWITYPTKISSCTFKKKFIFDKEIKSAFLNITSIGWYQAFVNGKLVNIDVFAPGYTQYRKRVQFQTYNIKNLINNEIQLSIDVGDGWGGGNHFAWANGDYYPYLPFSLIFDIEIVYKDNSIEHFVSDETLDVFTNEILFSDIYDGEIQDRTKDIEYIGKAIISNNCTNIVPQEGENIVFGERFKALNMWKDFKGETIVDFGQNFCGMVEINVKGNRGDKVSFTLGEVLDKNGNFYNENYRTAKAFYSYTLSGEEQIYRPKFSFMGGRYIKLIDCPSYLSKENFEAVLVHSNIEKTCSFECGNPKIQRLYLNTVYGQLSNYLDIPTDCPQRDERLGWTADAQVFTKTAAIHFNVNKFFRKWLRDMILDQGINGEIDGVIPRIYPNENKYIGISTGWGDSCCVIPWEIYYAYNDKDLLKECLPMMRKWINYLKAHQKKPNIIELEWSWGDWLAMDKYQDGNPQGLTRYDLITTAYYAYDIMTYIKACEILNIECDEYKSLLIDVKKSYQQEFIKDGHMIGEIAYMFSNIDRTAYTQTGIILTLAFDLCNENDKKSLLNDLVNLIKACDNRMSTGFLGTPYILSTLSDNGEKDLAYQLLLSEAFPSWLYSVNKGATTMWEHYDGIKEDGSFWFSSMNSFNHYAYGAVFSWIFNNVAGIKPLKPGYEEISIKPLINKEIGYCNLTFKCKCGDIRVYWDAREEKATYKINVPKGISGIIELENGYKVEFKNGIEVNL